MKLEQKRPSNGLALGGAALEAVGGLALGEGPDRQLFDLQVWLQETAENQESVRYSRRIGCRHRSIPSQLFA
jgi:hypothetical protein